MCCSSPFFFDWNSWLKPRTCAIAWPPRIATHRDLNRKWMCSRSIDPHCVFVYYFFSPHIFFIYNNNTIINNIFRIFLSNRKQKYSCLSKHHFHQVNHVLFCWQQSTGLLLRGAEGLEWVFWGGRRDRASELMDDRRKSSAAVNYFNVARMRSGAVFAYPRGAHSAASCWSFFNPAAKKQTNARPTDDNQG